MPRVTLTRNSSMIRLKSSEIPKYREEMLKAQGGKCAFCGRGCKKPCLDHSHREPYRDKVRGVLCWWCNIAIGKLENSRVMTGTSWNDFADSFSDAYDYIYGRWGHMERLGCLGYDKSDWHPSKRNSERIEFEKLSSDGQNVALCLMDQDKTEIVDPKNATQRIALFRKLNNKT